MKNVKIGILGCAGRNGRLLLKEVYEDTACHLIGGTVREGGSGHGEDLGTLAGLSPLGIYAHAQPGVLFEASDVLIDFTNATSTLYHVDLAIEYQKPIVIGTTGFTDDERRMIIQKSDKTPILLASNMTLGVALLSILVEKVSEVLDETYDIEVLEIHHRHKKDTPSGTTRSLVRAAHRGRKNEDKSKFVIHDQPGEREKGTIGVSVVRGGNEIGTHSVCFYGNEEVLELTHRVKDRGIFAKGAVRAAKWLYGRHPGLYRLKDVLKDSDWNIE
jgi:4-hydroxy-tetrahydrodipicolinate reductase